MKKTKYKQILILYHVPEREHIICQMLADCIREDNLADEIIIDEAYKLFRHMYDYSPDLVISFFPRDVYSTCVFSFIKMTYKCRLVCIPNEQYVNFTQERMKVVFGYNDIPRNLIDCCLFWGPGLAEYGGKYLLDNEKVTNECKIGIFGYLPYQIERVKKYYIESPCLRKIDKIRSNYIKTVLIVTAVFAKPWSQNDFSHQSAYDINDKVALQEVRDTVYSMNYYAEQYLEMIELIARDKPQVLFVVKLHPVDVNTLRMAEATMLRFDRFKNLDNVVLVDEPYQISQYMKDVSLFVHYGSTSSMEAFVHGIPSVLLTNDCKRVVRNTYGTTEHNGGDVIIPVSNVDGLKQYIDRPPIVDNNSKVAENAYKITNFKINENYKPDKLVVEILRSLDLYQSLDFSDATIRKMIKNKDFLFIMLHWGSDYMKSIGKIDVKKAKKIRNMVSLFFSYCFENKHNKDNY